ncbi:MAG: helix-turn-helix domain-containing protein [Thermoplasmata archaeon]
MHIDLPEGTWLRTFSRRHPEARIEVIHRFEASRELIVDDVRLGPRENPAYAQEIVAAPEVRQVENLRDAGEPGVYRVVYRAPRFVHTAREFGVPPRYPFVVRNGISTWTLICHQSSVPPFVKELRARVPGVELEALPASRDGPASRELTRRQREIFDRAMDEGYFDVPRRTSLTALAQRIGVSKSTLSESLAITEFKLLEGRGSP